MLAPAFVRHLISAPPSGRVRLASFGANGMAWSDLTSHLAHPKVDLVTVAEVDSRRLEKLASKDPEAKVRVYQDWRRLLEKEAKNLDAVTIATPDHMHAPIGVASMQLGLHAYIQKPLAHDLHEVRRLTEIARERKVQTQMGIQVHSSAQYRTAVNLIHSGVIGKIREVHTWSNKKWGDSEPEPTHSDPVPQELNWDLWLGVAQERPFVNGVYHPSHWRKRLAFGTGTFGDMGCHIYDPVFKSLGVGAPISVRSEGPAPSSWSWAINAVVHYEFPGSKFTDGKTVKVVWYDGDEKPPTDIQSLIEGQAIPAQGSIFIGTKGRMLLPHVDWPKLFPLAEFKDYQIEKASAEDHRAQFIDAVLGGPSPSASFDYSGPLTEAILLGGVASFHPKTTLEWDTATMRFPKHPAADKLVKRAYRKGWEVPGLG